MSFPDRNLTPRPNTGIPANHSSPSLPPRPLSFGGHFNQFQADQPTHDEPVYSREDTTFSGIDQHTVREIWKRFDSGAKIADVVQKAIEAYMGGGVGVDIARVAEIITQIVEEDVLHNIGGTNVRGQGTELSVRFRSMICDTCTRGE